MKIFPEDAYIFQRFSFIRNRVNNAIRASKKRYYSSKLESEVAYPKKLWKTVNSLIYNRQNTKSNYILPDEITINETKFNDRQTILNHLNFCFTSICDRVDQSRTADEYFYQNLFEFHTVTCTEVQDMLTSIKNGISPGYDGLNSHLLKTVSSILVQPLTRPLTTIINKGIDESEFPNEMKIAKVRPIFKNGNKNSPTNYRPISVLPILSKPFEKILKNQMDEFLSQHNFINIAQYGFMANSNTTAACADFVGQIQTSLDLGKKTSCISIDLRKAFDSIQHSVLKKILVEIGSSERAVALIDSYLSERMQFIEIEGVQSQRLEIKCGVPQGSILGPLLFIIYINGIFNLNLFGNLIMYADDAIICYSCDSIDQLNQQMQSDLNTISTWLHEHHLQINVDKSFYVVLGNNNVELNLTILNTSLSTVESFRYLGLLITKKLSWNVHINEMGKKISPYIFILYKLNSLVSRSILYKIYYAHIHSRITYMNCIWSTAPAYSIHTVLQNRDIKAIHNLPRLTPTTSLYSEKLLPINMLGKFELILLFHKLLTNRIRSNIQIQRNNEMHTHIIYDRMRTFTYPVCVQREVEMVC